ncbi:MAG: PKD domain-containing protein [Phycisphaerae bacterium]
MRPVPPSTGPSILIAVTMCVGTGCETPLNAVIVASRTEGMAPLAVFFEGTESTDANGRKIGDSTGGDGLLGNDLVEYTWDFGDGTSFSGFNAAHVYEQAGIYRARLTVTDIAGNEHYVEQPITVNEFSGTTICRANDDSDWRGCPLDTNNDGVCDVSPANCQVTSSYTGVGSGTRALYRRGDTFTYSASPSIGSNAIIGAFGDCVNPDERGICENSPLMRYTGSGGDSAIPEGGSPKTIMDIHIDGNDIAGNNVADGDVGILGSDDLLVLRVFYDHYNRSPIYADKLFIVNSVLTNADKQNMFFNGSRLVLIGNSIGPVAIEHNLYGEVIDRGVIERNQFYDGRWAGVRIAANEAPGSWNVVVSQNEFKGMPVPLDLKVTQPGSPYTAHNILIERNHFVGTDRTIDHPRCGYSGITIRNNIIETSGFALALRSDAGQTPLGVDGLQFFNNTVITSGVYPAITIQTLDHQNVEIFNNIIQCTSSSSSVRALEIGAFEGMEQITCDFNVYHLPNRGSDPVAFTVGGTDYTVSQWLDSKGQHANSLWRNPEFVRDNPDCLAEARSPFELCPGSHARDEGIQLPSVRDDFGHMPPWPAPGLPWRPQGTAHDIGAFEME